MVQHVKDKVGPEHMLAVHNTKLAAALYADDMVLVVPQPTSRQLQLDAAQDFCAAESLRISTDKTLVLQLNCAKPISLQG